LREPRKRVPHQLFNLVDDPRELVNLYQQQPEIASRLEASLRTWCDPDEAFRLAHQREQELLAGIAAAGFA
jgi:hypothetical protein